MTIEQRLGKWRTWSRSILNEVGTLVVDDHIFRKTKEIIREASIKAPSDFSQWMARQFAHTTLVGIRRQTDWEEGAITIARLLAEMRDTPEVLSKERFLSRYSARPRMGEKEFARYADPFGKHLNPAIPARDLADLRNSTAKLRAFTNKRIAHSSKRIYRGTPVVFAELSAGVRKLEELAVKYRQLLVGSCSPSLLPTWQEPWEAVFTVPWIRPKSKKRFLHG